MLLTSVSPAEPPSQERLKMRQEMIEFVVQNLRQMLFAYAKSIENKPIYYQQELLMDYRLAYEWLYNHDRLRNFPIQFISDPEFKTHTSDINVLAINTGTEILMNSDRIAEMPDFSFFKAVQLMLHEFNHLINEVHEQPHRKNSPKLAVDLNTKDRFVDRLKEYLESKAKTAVSVHSQSNKNVQFTVLEMDESKEASDLFEILRSQGRFGRDGEKSYTDPYLAWFQSDSDFKEDNSLRYMMRMKEHQFFSKSISLSDAQREESVYYSFPKTQIQEVTANADGKFSVRVFYQERVINSQYRSFISIAKPITYSRIYSGISRWNQKSDRAFSFRFVQPDLSFEIENTFTKDKEAYVTLKVLDGTRERTSKAIEWIKSGVVSVQARDSNGNRFSFPVSRKIEKNGELKFQFRIPHILNLRVTEILVQNNLGSAKYEEHSIRAQGPQDLKFSDEALAAAGKLDPVRNKKLDQFDFWLGASDNKLSIRLPFQLDQIEGMTLEFRATLEVVHAETKYPNGPKYYQTAGFKVFFDRKKLDQFKSPPPWKNELVIPLADEGWPIQKIEEPQTAQDHDDRWFRRTPNPRYLEDTGKRGVTSAWLHFKNGQTIKLDYDSEPFATIFDKFKREWDRKAKDQRRREYKASRCEGVYGSY